MTGLQRLASVVVTVLILVGVGALSQFESGLGGDEALLRLSWRAAALRVEACRALSEEELDRLAPHMRRSEECTGETLDYELRVAVDGRRELLDTVAPSGARRDRPVYVFYDVPMSTGVHDVTVDFRPLVPTGTDLGDAPLAWGWRGEIRAEKGRIRLITLASDGRTLEAR